eukprot:gene14823-5939_t
MGIEEKKTANSEFHVPQEQTGSQPSKETSEEATTKSRPKDGVDNYGAELDEAIHKASSAFEKFSSTSKRAYEILIGDYNAFIEEKKIFETMTKKLKETQFSNIVTLNIGGEKYSTGLPTFKKWKDSYFEKMFSGRIVLEKSSDGSFFIDRDGSLFRGLKDWFTDAGVIASGSVDQALEGRHYFHSMQLLKECFDALGQFRIEDLTGTYSNTDVELLSALKMLRKNPSASSINDVMKTLRGYGVNQFSSDHPKCLSTGTEIDPAVVKNMLSASEIGNEAFSTFVSERLIEGSKSFFAPIKRIK